jgi:hypothetical protein
MRIPLDEIWAFLELIGEEGEDWTYALQCGSYILKDIGPQTLIVLKDDPSFDTELLPTIFTFREILWQPDVFVDAQKSITPLRVLKAECEEQMRKYGDDTGVQRIYKGLLNGMMQCCEKAEREITQDEKKATDGLSAFRLCTFPIVKFFISHPCNRRDYYIDAMNRLNYAVKIMLTQFYGQYSQLSDPVWLVEKG